MQSLSPVKAADREIFMDVLRGFAILGIFIANLHAFSGYRGNVVSTGPYFIAGWDHKMSFLHYMFIEGKFYSIFSLLFGWGIALQFKRGEANGMNALPTVRRRLFFMVLLGLMHILLWTGDIVLLYSMLGFLLIPFRKFSNRTLLITAALLILSPILLYWLKMNFKPLNAPAMLMYATGEKVDGIISNIKSEEEYQELIKNGGWWDILKTNVAGIFFRYGDLFFQSRIPKVLGMFLVGYVIGRTGFYANFQQHKRKVIVLIVCGLLIGIPANYYLAKYMGNQADYYNQNIKGLYRTIVYALGVVPLAIAYTGTFMLAFQNKTGNRILSILAPVGKMAFSNYVLQTIVGCFIFLNPGLGYMGKVGPVYYTLLGLIVFIFQVIISTLWLRYFNYGPIEWLWRSATYKKWQPFKRIPSST